MFTHPELKKEIQGKLGHLKNRDNIDGILREHSLKINHRESLHHSSRIENPYSKVFDPGSTLSKKAYLNNFEQTFENLQEAWKYGLENITIPFDESFLIDLTYKISPEDKEKAENSFRPITYSVKIAGSSVTPPYPAKVPKEMKQFFERIGKMN